MIKIYDKEILTEAAEVLSDPGFYKVVKVNGEFRFRKVDLTLGYHADAVRDGEEATAACSISIPVSSDFFKFDSLQSTMLKVGFSEEDEEELIKFLGIEAKREW